MHDDTRDRKGVIIEEERPPAFPDPDTWDDLVEAGEEDVPTAVLYIVAGLLLLSFTLYLAVGGGHSHFH
jgi:hypothetical protein